MKALYLLLLPIIAGGFALLGANTVNAQSAWDNTVNITTDLTLTNRDTSFVKDITDTWDIEIGQACGSTVLEFFQEMTNKSLHPNSAYVISNYIYHETYAFAGYKNTVYINFTKDKTKLNSATTFTNGPQPTNTNAPNGSLIFEGGVSSTTTRLNAPFYADSFQDFMTIELTMEANRNVRCQQLHYGQNVSQPYRFDQYQPLTEVKLFANEGFLVAYPENYQGATVPGLPSMVGEVTPDIEITSGQSHLFNFRDKRFNTFDPIEWTCDDTTAPILHYQVFEGQEESGNTLFKEGAISSTIDVKLALEPDKLWTLVTWYNCGGSPSFTKSLFTQFQTTSVGFYTDVPNFYIDSIYDYKVTFSDRNFNTFDPVPFTCNDGTAPLIIYEIMKLDTMGLEVETAAEGFFNSTLPFSVQLPKSNKKQFYNLNGQYQCAPDDPVIFSKWATVEFEVTSNGTMNIDIFGKCINEQFPFIHFEACAAAIDQVINLLIFGRIQLPHFEFNPQCVQLHTMDNWLNLPNGYVVCPQIPAMVRDITTPFVFFLLGIVTVGFINKMRGDPK